MTDSAMQRRSFLTLLGGAAAAWPLAAGAQQPERMRRIGVLMNVAPEDPESQARVAAFAQTLQELGWTIGRNLRIEYRWVAGEADRNRTSAEELVALAPDVLLASGGRAVLPLQQATRSVPIVFAAVPDPVAAGFVDSLARPGGNTTGFAAFEYSISGKWLELLKQIKPQVTRVAVIRTPTIGGGAQFGAIQGAAPSFGVEVTPVDARDADEIERRITAFVRGPTDGLIVTMNALTTLHRSAALPATSTASSGARSRPTCRYRHR
jgi:ABC-type uncharacterized transport system substrate-binding protein